MMACLKEPGTDNGGAIASLIYIEWMLDWTCSDDASMISQSVAEKGDTMNENATVVVNSWHTSSSVTVVVHVWSHAI